MVSSLPNHKYLQFTDEALAKLAQSGNETAASVILDRYRSFVKGIASNYFGASLETDDIVQEGMIALLSAVYSFSQEKNAVFKTFAGVCINNRLKTVVKSNAGLKHAPLNTYVPLDDVELCSEADPEQMFISEEDARSLMLFIKKHLSELENEVLSFYILGLDYRSIAKKCEISEKAVNNAMQRIRAKLKKALNLNRS